MSLLHALSALRAAGVVSIVLNPHAATVRIVGAPPDDALRALVASHKAQLLALAGGAPLVASPEALVTLARPCGVPRGYAVDQPAHWVRAGWRVTGPNGWRTVATSYSAGVSLAQQHAAQPA